MQDQRGRDAGKKIDGVVAELGSVGAYLIVGSSLPREVTFHNQNAPAVRVRIGLKVPILKAKRIRIVGNKEREVGFHAQTALETAWLNLIPGDTLRPIRHRTADKLVNAVSNGNSLGRVYGLQYFDFVRRPVLTFIDEHDVPEKVQLGCGR